MGIRIITDKCNGCGACLTACPFGAISIIDDKAVIGAACTLCGICITACPYGAIAVAEKEERKELADFSAHRGVWVVAEQRKGQLAEVTLELLGEGRKLADILQEELIAVLAGTEIEDIAKDLIAYGADRVYLLQHPNLAHFLEGPYTGVLVDLFKAEKPNIVLMGATALGRSLAPRIAARLQTGLTADCTGLAIDPSTKNLLQTRPAFGGNLMATILCPDHRPQMATVRHRVFRPPAEDRQRSGQISLVNLADSEFDLRAKLLEVIVKSENGYTNIQEASIIVAGGRGLGDSKNFKLIEELAEVLGGAPGASRAAVDAGWADHHQQVGQTGKTVAPKIYFACGIHGAVQHMAGMQSSDIIIAINKNPAAPIFNISTYGLVGDALEILPLLTKEFKKALR